MKQKRLIMVLLTVLAILLISLVFWKPWSKINENTASENGSETDDGTEKDNSEQNEAPQSGITILEDEGTIIIEIPEDQDSDGF